MRDEGDDVDFLDRSLDFSNAPVGGRKSAPPARHARFFASEIGVERHPANSVWL